MRTIFSKVKDLSDLLTEPDARLRRGQVQVTEHEDRLAEVGGTPEADS